MSLAGISGMRSAAGDLIDIAGSLNEGEWQTPSAAAGWSVQDVVSHVGCLLELLQTAVRGEALPDSGIEPLNEVMVAGRRDWDAARTLDNVQKQLDQAITLFIPLQEPPMALRRDADVRSWGLSPECHRRHVHLRHDHPPAL